MTAKSSTMPFYLATPCLGIWHLGDGGEVFVMTSDSRAIVFAEELAQVLRAYIESEAKLPPLTSILLILSALQSGTTREGIANNVRRLDAATSTGKAIPDKQDSALDSTCDWLASLRRISNQLHDTPAAKSELLRALQTHLAPFFSIAAVVYRT